MIGIVKIIPTRSIRSIKPSNKKRRRLGPPRPVEPTDADSKITDAEKQIKHIDEKI
jgi:hypothetical protein